MKIRTYPNDQIILAIILLLSGFGIVMMYSASQQVPVFHIQNHQQPPFKNNRFWELQAPARMGL